MSHDVGRGHGSSRRRWRDSIGAVLRRRGDSDRLYWPGHQSERLAKSLPNPVEVRYIASPIGHDGFLTEIEQLGDALAEQIFS